VRKAEIVLVWDVDRPAGGAYAVDHFDGVMSRGLVKILGPLHPQRRRPEDDFTR
jgi:hypothetical protein